jgi:polar amino acid transport system substrate-binding protein
VLERTLTRGTLYEADSEAAALAALKSGKVQALAQNRSMLLRLSQSLPGSRVVDDRFLAAELAFALPKGHPGALAYVSDFIEKAKASGLVEKSIESAGLHGVNVAPAK